jgi:hypothetical protein
MTVKSQSEIHFIFQVDLVEEVGPSDLAVDERMIEDCGLGEDGSRRCHASNADLEENRMENLVSEHI